MIPPKPEPPPLRIVKDPPGPVIFLLTIFSIIIGLFLVPFFALGAVQGTLGPTSTGSVNIRITILPPPITEQQILSTNNGETISYVGRTVKIIKNEGYVLIEPQ